MELLTTKRVMDRVLQNPNMRKLELSSAATYIKDFCSINDILPILESKFMYLNIEDYKAEVPPEMARVDHVYICKFTVDDIEYDSDAVNPHPAIYRDGTLLAASSESIINEKDKTLFGEYKIENGVLFTDIEQGIVEVYGPCMRVDDLGFPVLIYDGALMQAVENYIKFRYYTILSESNIVPDKFADKAHQQYAWYIAQYDSKINTPSYDEAISIANNWQRLILTRNRNTRGGSYPQFKITAKTGRYNRR